LGCTQEIYGHLLECLPRVLREYHLQPYGTAPDGKQFTGDGAGRDHEGYYWIRGRVDDVVNVSGHRLSTAEIEAALIEHRKYYRHQWWEYNTEDVLDQVAEAAVVGINDELTGQAVNAFVSLKEGNETSDQVRKDLISQVRKSIGPFAAPKAVFVVDDLPKTRSGKIMRRILRKILSGEEDSLGDISTVSNGSIVEPSESVLTANVAIWPERGGVDYQDCSGVAQEVKRNHRIVAVSIIQDRGLDIHFSACLCVSGGVQLSFNLYLKSKCQANTLYALGYVGTYLTHPFVRALCSSVRNCFKVIDSYKESELTRGLGVL